MLETNKKEAKTMKPLIGIASSAFYDSFADIDFNSMDKEIVENCWERMCLTGKMSRHINSSGGAAEILSLKNTDEQIDTIASRYDGFLFCGGADITPSLYGEEINGSKDIDGMRDKFELSLLKKAYEKGKTIFGICRGQQMINIAFGGTLHQDINGIDEKFKRHQAPYPMDSYIHTVKTVMPQFIPEGAGSEFRVNSAHHQAIKKIADGFEATAYSDDGIIEGIAMPSYKKGLIGVQWHPESLADFDPIHHNFFKMLVEYAKIS